MSEATGGGVLTLQINRATLAEHRAVCQRYVGFLVLKTFLKQ